jgi:hypothetical protein
VWLYIGARASWSYAIVSPALCADPMYVETRTSRMALVEWKSDQLGDYCGKVRPHRRSDSASTESACCG